VVRTSKVLIAYLPLSPSLHPLPPILILYVCAPLSLSLSLSLYKAQKLVQRDSEICTHTDFVNSRGLMRNTLIPSKLEEDLFKIYLLLETKEP